MLTADTPRTRKLWNLLPEALLIIIGVLVLLATAHPTTSGDGEQRFADLAALWSGHMPAGKYSAIQPVLASPAYALAVATGAAPQSLVAYFNLALVMTIGTLCTILLARRTTTQVALWSALLMLSASMLPNHLQAFYGEVLSALLLVLAVLIPHRMPIARGIFGALAIVATPVLVVPLAAAGVGALVLRRTWWPLAAAIGGAIGVAAEAWVRFGSLAASPYFTESERGFATVLPYSGLPGFSYPVLFGVLSVVLSFGKGVVWFIPGLFAFGFADVRRWFDRAVADLRVIGVFAVVMVIAYGAWWAWYGGNFWGPRFFLLLCFPAAVALAMAIRTSVSWKSRLVVSVLVITSAWVGVDGYVFGQQGLDICWADNYRLEFLCWYVPEFSALWHPFVTGSIWSAYGDPRRTFVLWALLTTGLLVYRTWRGRTTAPTSSAAEPLDDSSPTPQPSSPHGPASPTSTPVSSSSETDSDA